MISLAFWMFSGTLLTLGIRPDVLISFSKREMADWLMFLCVLFHTNSCAKKVFHHSQPSYSGFEELSSAGVSESEFCESTSHQLSSSEDEYSGDDSVEDFDDEVSGEDDVAEEREEVLRRDADSLRFFVEDELWPLDAPHEP